MWVGHFLDSNTTARGYRRTKIWSRLITWDSEIAAGELLSVHAEARLEHMGLRPLSWWFFDDGVPHWYACLERIPGSTATWRD